MKDNKEDLDRKFDLAKRSLVLGSDNQKRRLWQEVRDLAFQLNEDWIFDKAELVLSINKHWN